MRIDQRLGTVSQGDPIAARATWDQWRVDHGYKPGRPLLSLPGENMKLAKGELVTYGLSLAQANTSGTNVCPWSTPSCRASCVAKNGNGRFSSVPEARTMKTRFLLAEPQAFCTLLAAEIDAAYRRHGKALRIRLNTFSDITWERVAPWLFTGPRRNVRFYDYTKGWDRTPPPNYKLTLSASERTSSVDIHRAVVQGRNVAVVLPESRTAPLRMTFEGLRVIDGDKTDNRADDPRGVVVGLRAKGSMRQEERGMVRR